MSPSAIRSHFPSLKKYALLAAMLLSLDANALSLISWNLESDGAEISTLNERLASMELVDFYGLSEVAPSWPSEIAKKLNSSGNRFEIFTGESGRNDRLAIAFDAHKYTLVERFSLAHINVNGRVRAPLVGRFREIKSGTEFYFMVNHLYRSKKSARVKQSKMLNEWIQGVELPVIAVGDYNYDWHVITGEVRHDKGFDMITKSGVVQWVVPEKLVRTQCSRYNTVLDFVFVSGELRSKRHKSSIKYQSNDYCDLNKKEESDHRPIWASIELS